jgi:3-deoxy-D-manno-octulosonic-acid transferase
MLGYRVILTIAAPVLAAAFVIRRLKGQEDRESLANRFGDVAKADRPKIWLHGASNGELNSARPLIEALRQARPDLPIIVTSNSITGRDLVNGWSLPMVSAVCAPLDFRWMAKRFLRRQRVEAFISLENELWPNRITAAADQDVPVIFVAARLSKQSAKVWRRMPGIRAQMLAAIKLLAPQDKGSRQRFLTLGVRQARLAPLVDLKALYVAKPVETPALPEFPYTHTWLAASTHEGEDALVLEAHKALLERDNRVRLILAPRHPRRAAAIRDLIEDAGLISAQRSQLDEVTPETQVFLADTLGEMHLWYSAARATFVGGSLIDRGGHTPYEPAAYGTALLHGPYLSNFQKIYRQLDAADAAIPVADGPSLAAGVDFALSSPLELVQNASAVTRQAADLETLIARILPLLPRPVEGL